MAAKTTAKVAALTGAAKDDILAAGNEDTRVADLNVLANDPGAARLWSLDQGVPAMAPGLQVPTSLAGVFVLASGATISANADGTVHYDGSALSLQSLAQGQTFTDQFVYTVRMANGALSTASVSVQIAGVNDAPTLVGAAGVINDTAAADDLVTISGFVAGSDVDNGAVLTYSLVGGSSAHGDLTFNADGTWSFTGAVDAMLAGEQEQAVFQVQVTDEHGAVSNLADIVIGLNGANDTADVAGDDAGSVTEDGTTTAEGTVTVSDRDAGQSAFAAIDAAALHGTYGDFSFDGSTGEWDYVLRNADANVQALTAADHMSDTLVIASLDGSDSITVTVAVNGADEPLPPPPPPPPVDEPTYKVTHGRDVSTHNVFTGFGSDDDLLYTPNLTYVGTTLVDFDGNGSLESTRVDFIFQAGPNTKYVDATLVGYVGFTLDQLLAVNEV
jgi:VCBS repeat-containing protein